eukprot:TRINITY_DN6520_c0_g1_i1.p1 TRINITY_DN6520_c0_g1~~TRINITY_DN6520_c0_g1_i1.p1  ORF type:complete len:199 (-),score=42.62 TRINITY_DN6520_c0_g1_i1:99-674(-)
MGERTRWVGVWSFNKEDEAGSEVEVLTLLPSGKFVFERKSTDKKGEAEDWEVRGAWEEKQTGIYIKGARNGQVKKLKRGTLTTEKLRTEQYERTFSMDTLFSEWKLTTVLDSKHYIPPKGAKVHSRLVPQPEPEASQSKGWMTTKVLFAIMLFRFIVWMIFSPQVSGQGQVPGQEAAPETVLFSGVGNLEE